MFAIDNEVETIEKDQTAMLYQAITTHNQLKPRQYLDEFVYSEHMDNKVLLQVWYLKLCDLLKIVIII